MSVLAVIPARYASTRLPAKPLVKATGKFLIQHTYERVTKASRIDRVVVATDDARIAEAVESFGGAVVMTDPDHPTGTDRVAEVSAGDEAEIVLNVQGDEPEIEPSSLDQLISIMESSGAEMGTLACAFDRLPIGHRAEADKSSAVKVVVDGEGFALYFSRSLIPYPRNHVPEVGPFLHLGVYGYTKAYLAEFAGWSPTPLEMAEGLEQLRALEHGRRMIVGRVETAALGIDTPEDYEAFVNRYLAGMTESQMDIVEGTQAR
jgi:3-deoxy-manno-octulosonate cytidylyltransferase (CMP-KDO synthetase)